MSHPRSFLDIDRFDPLALRMLFARARALKDGTADDPRPLRDRTLAMIFEKPSTRTRVSFQVGMQQLGGQVVVLSENESQIGRGETIADTARVLSRYADAIMIRTNAHQKLLELAEYATIPVINGLTDETHPCQIMADVMTFEEHRGPIAGKVVAWCGDANNVASSWIHAAVRFGFRIRLATPAELRPNAKVLEWARAQGGDVAVLDRAEDAVADADCVVTDTWVSMGHKNADHRRAILTPFRVDEALMARAKPDAVFMHCLPAHRGEEVTDAVMDGPRSIIWDEAENRMHVQKGILAWAVRG